MLLFTYLLGRRRVPRFNVFSSSLYTTQSNSTTYQRPRIYNISSELFAALSTDSLILFCIRSAMCLGTTATCRSCKREAIRFYPGGRCDEVKPFPAWHRIRGHTRRVRRCPDCIRTHEDSFSDELEERNARFRRVYRRMKTFNRYCRGEQANPLPDDEFTRDRDHPVIVDGESSNGRNERRMDGTSQHMLRRHSFAFRQHFSPPTNTMPTQVSFTQEVVAEHNSTQIDHLGEYQAFRRLYPFDSTAAMEELAVFRAEA